MVVWKLMGLLTSAALAIGGTSGCSLAVTPASRSVAVGPGSGSVTVTWSVAGGDDPSLCDQYGADDIEVVVYDEGGNQVVTSNAPCDSFSTTVPLPEGTYSADVTLVDAGGNAITTTKQLASLDVVAGTDLAVDLDFPSSSIL